MITRTNTYFSITYGNWYAGTSAQFHSFKEAKDFYEDVKATEIWGHINKITIIEERTSFLFKKTYQKEIMLDSFNVLHDN